MEARLVTAASEEVYMNRLCRDRSGLKLGL